MTKLFLYWVVQSFAKIKDRFRKKTVRELKDELFPNRKLMEHEQPDYKKPVEGVDPVKMAAARIYAKKQKQRQFSQMQKYGKTDVTDRAIRKYIKKHYGITVQETNSETFNK